MERMKEEVASWVLPVPLPKSESSGRRNVSDASLSKDRMQNLARYISPAAVLSSILLHHSSYHSASYSAQSECSSAYHK